MFKNAFSGNVVVMRPYKDVCGRNFEAQGYIYRVSQEERT